MTAPKQRQPRRKGLTEEELHRQFPTLTHLASTPGRASKRAWVAVFAERPEAMYSLLADYIKQAHAQPGRIGQRPMPREEQVDLEALVRGNLCDEPLTEVLPKLVTLSERAMCQQVHLSRTQWQRLLRGEYEPDMAELKRIAEVVGKPPAYFREYRAMAVTAAFVRMITDRPGFATKLYREFLEVQV